MKIKKTCSRGHIYYKSSDCPVCPKCWAGYYRERNNGDFPEKISAPALRALLNEKIFNLEQLADYSEKEILKFHGMGPASIPMLKAALKKKGLKFKDAPKSKITKAKTEKKVNAKKSEIIGGYLVKYHANGKTKWSKGKVKDGKPEGYWEWYRPDGTLKRSGHFKKGEVVGEWITYDAAGKVYKVTQKD